MMLPIKLWNFFTDCIHGLEHIAEITGRIWRTVERFTSWLISQAWFGLVAILSFFWGLCNAAVVGLEAALEMFGLIKEQAETLPDKVGAMPIAGFFEQAVEFLNYCVPLEELITFLAGYFSLVIACLMYRSIKSWMPFV